MNKLEEFSDKMRFFDVGLKDYIDNFSKFKFYFFQICFQHLKYSPQFPSSHQCRQLKCGASSSFRCIKFHNIVDKCNSQIKFKYLKADDSLEIVSSGCCDHFQNFYEAEAEEITDDEIDCINKKQKLY